MSNPRILLLDIETAPIAAYIWGLWKKVYSMEMVSKNWYILCWCAKWYGEDKIIKSALPYYSLYEREPENDRCLMNLLWPLLNEAHIIVGHNVKQFDLPKIRTRFLHHKIKPPSPYRIVDTLKIAQAKFAFTSNKLDNIAKELGLGQKEDTGGFDLWRRCMWGDREAWDKMVSYCAQDVRLLEKVYEAFIPYDNRAPNHGIYKNEFCCPKCGSTNVHKRGYAYTTQNKYHRFQCQDCGGWGRSKKAIKLRPDLVPAL